MMKRLLAVFGLSVFASGLSVTPCIAQMRALRVEMTGTGTGAVHDCRAADDCSGGRIVCGTQCMALYADGASVLLKAMPDADSAFSGWLVNGEPPTSNDLQMTQDVTVTAMFTRCAPPIAKTLTVAFLEGVNLADGVTERDDTILSLGVGANLSAITEIILPNMPHLFNFTDAVTFHFEYRNAQAVVVPEAAVAQMAVVDAASGGLAYADIGDDDAAEFPWATPAAQPISAETQSVVFRRADGRILKIGTIMPNRTEGTVTFAFADLASSNEGECQ